MTCLSRLLALLVGFGLAFFVLYGAVSIIPRDKLSLEFYFVILIGAVLLMFLPLALIERPRSLRRKAEQEARAAQAAAEALAAVQKKQEVEDILGKYAGGSDNPGRSATYTDDLTDSQISQGREMDMDLHGRIMG